MEGWIKIHRRLLNWEWWDDHNTTRLFIYCLLKANHSNAKWRGQDIKRGQFITGLNSLSAETGITLQSIRTSLKKLKSTNELTIKTNNKNSLVTVINYDLYQEKNETNKPTNKQLTNNQQTTNKQPRS